MSLNLASILTLAAVLALGLTTRHFLKRYLKEIDGVVGLTTPEKQSQALPL